MCGPQHLQDLSNLSGAGPHDAKKSETWGVGWFCLQERVHDLGRLLR